MRPTMIQIVAANMIAEVTSRGQTPVTFLMNAATANRIADEVELQAKAQMSTAKRFWFWLRNGKGGPEKLTHLCGVPVTEAPHVPDGGIFLQTYTGAAQLSDVPAGLEQAAKFAAEEMERRRSEFWEKHPVAPPAVPDAQAGDAAPTLNDLSSGGGERPTASDVLIKALDRADELAGVVVIRVYANKDLDMAMNVDSYTCQGILQKAQFYLAQRGM